MLAFLSVLLGSARVGYQALLPFGLRACSQFVNVVLTPRHEILQSVVVLLFELLAALGVHSVAYSLSL